LVEKGKDVNLLYYIHGAKKKQRENTVIAGRLSIQIQLVMFKGVAFNIMEI
jgi:hypothetical protein